jgi:hypothetical protein
VLRGHDTWQRESPGVDRTIRMLDLQDRAAKARGELERATNLVRGVLTDPLMAERPDLADVLRALCLQTGALGLPEEAC